jgi:hypothetical protein
MAVLMRWPDPHLEFVIGDVRHRDGARLKASGGRLTAATTTKRGPETTLAVRLAKQSFPRGTILSITRLTS